MFRTALLTAALFTAGITGKAVVKGYVQSSPALVVEAADRIPAGATLPAVLAEPVGVYLNGVGDPVDLQLIGSVKDRSGAVVIPAGSRVAGRVAAIAKPATRGNQIALGLVVEGIEVGGRLVPASFEITQVAVERGSGSRDFGEVLGSADALASTGIDLASAGGAVIALGMGDEAPSIAAGTHVQLRLGTDLRLP